MNTPQNFRALDKIFMAGPYEVHVHYPQSCSDPVLKEEHMLMLDSNGMVGGEDHEPDNVMNADDRRYKAHSIFAHRSTDHTPLAVAFFVGAWGRDEPMSTSALTHAVNKQRMMNPANENHKNSKPPTVAWFKRLMGAQP